MHTTCLETMRLRVTRGRGLRCGPRQGLVVILYSYLVVFFLMTVTTAFLTGSSVEMLTAQRTTDGTEAFWLAEAGIDEAVWEYDHGGEDFLETEGWSQVTKPSLCPSLMVCHTKTLALSSGKVGIFVQDVNGDRPTVTATGQETDSNQSSTVSAQLPTGGGPRTGFLHAAFADASKVHVNSGSQTDSYDSRLGPYDAASAQSHGDVGTNQTGSAYIKIYDDSTVVSGDAYLGPGGDLDAGIAVAYGAVLEGEKRNLAGLIPIRPVSMPAVCIDLGDVVLEAGDFLHLAPGTYCADTIDLDGAGARIRAVGQGPVKLYVRDWVVMQNGALIGRLNPQGIGAERLQLYLEAGTYLPEDPEIPNNRRPNGCHDVWRFCAASSTVTATVYSPRTPVGLIEGTQWFGAVVGKRVTLKDGSALHYDESLSQAETDYGTGPGHNRRVTSWVNHAPASAPPSSKAKLIIPEAR